MKTRPGLVIILFITVVLSGIRHIIDIDDVGGAFWHGHDDPETGWGAGGPYRRQRVGSWEVRVLPPFIWAAGVRVQPRREGRDRQRWPDLGVIFLLVCRRRRVPDLMGAKPIRRVLSVSRRGTRDGGTLADMDLWSLF